MDSLHFGGVKLGVWPPPMFLSSGLHALRLVEKVVLPPMNAPLPEPLDLAHHLAGHCGIRNVNLFRLGRPLMESCAVFHTLAWPLVLVQYGKLSLALLSQIAPHKQEQEEAVRQAGCWKRSQDGTSQRVDGRDGRVHHRLRRWWHVRERQEGRSGGLDVI